MCIILFLQTFHVDTENVRISRGKVLRVVCRYCTVISRVGGLAVDVARAPAHPVVGVAGGLARAVGEPAESGGGIMPSKRLYTEASSPLLHVATVEAVPVAAARGGVLGLLVAGQRGQGVGGRVRHTEVLLQTHAAVLFVAAEDDRADHLAVWARSHQTSSWLKLSPAAG